MEGDRLLPQHSMIDHVAAAIERQDYKAAAEYLKPLLQKHPHDPWVRLYLGQIHEASGRLDSAEEAYRQVLKRVDNPKVALQARRGLARLEAISREKRQEAIARASTDPSNTGTAFLILEPIQGEARKPAAQQFAKIMGLDPYTAQMQLPSRGWRLYRVGKGAELQVYAEELQSQGIAAFWAPLAQLKGIHVFRVDYVQAMGPQVTVVCHNAAGQTGTLAFNWSEVGQVVRGMLPIFEDVIDLDAFKRLKRKEQTQDYAQVYDLHLAGRDSILRFCDRTYQFQQGIALGPHSATASGQNTQNSTRLRWNHLIRDFEKALGDRPQWSDFNAFAETSFDLLDLVEPFPTYIDVFRKDTTHWDAAFQLYSSLVFNQYSRQAVR